MPTRDEERMAAGIAEQIAGQVAARSSGWVRIVALIVVAVLGVFLSGAYLGTGGFNNGNPNNTGNTGNFNGNNNNTNNGNFNGNNGNNNNTNNGNTGNNGIGGLGGNGNNGAAIPTLVTNPGTVQFGVQLKQSGCRVNGALADMACTPGDIITTATKEQICVSGYSSSVRNVPTSEKDQVYASYGIASRTTGEYEVDHLVSLELGGSNDISNLWPEAASPTPGFHEKDQVENYMHAQVCAGAISLHDAQIQIATNWLAVWQQMGH